MNPKLSETLGNDLNFKLKYEELKSHQKACTDAITGLLQLSIVLQSFLHEKHPRSTFTNAISEFESELVGIEALIKRMETLGR